MLTKPIGTNERIINDISYLTTNNLLHKVNGEIPKPYTPADDIFSDPGISKLVDDINMYVWPETHVAKNLVRSGKATVLIDGVNFSTTGLYRMSILAGLFRGSD
jgi:hypothetical protein